MGPQSKDEQQGAEHRAGPDSPTSAGARQRHGSLQAASAPHSWPSGTPTSAQAPLTQVCPSGQSGGP